MFHEQLLTLYAVVMFPYLVALHNLCFARKGFWSILFMIIHPAGVILDKANTWDDNFERRVIDEIFNKL